MGRRRRTSWWPTERLFQCKSGWAPSIDSRKRGRSGWACVCFSGNVPPAPRHPISQRIHWSGSSSETCTLAKAVVEDQVSGLPAADQMARELPDVDLYDSTRLQTEQQIELAKRAEAAAMSMDSRMTNSEGGECDSSSGRVVLANSHGFLGEYQSSSFSMSVSPIATDPETGAMQRDAWYDVQRKFAKLATPESVGLEAARRTVRKLGARKVATQPSAGDLRFRNGRQSHGESLQCGFWLFTL